MMMKKPLSTLVFFFICIAMLAKPGQGWALPPLPPPFTWPKPGQGWALPPLPPPFTWPKPGQGWALPPLPSFPWPKPGHGWALPPKPAHKFPPINWPKPGKAFPPLPFIESPSKCWSALKEIKGCVHDIASSFLTGKFNVGPSCCKTYMDVKDDCSVHGHGVFDIPFFHQALEQYCSSQIAPPSKA